MLKNIVYATAYVCVYVVEVEAVEEPCSRRRGCRPPWFHAKAAFLCPVFLRAMHIPHLIRGGPGFLASPILTPLFQPCSCSLQHFLYLFQLPIPASFPYLHVKKNILAHAGIIFSPVTPCIRRWPLKLGVMCFTVRDGIYGYVCVCVCCVCV